MAAIPLVNSTTWAIYRGPDQRMASDGDHREPVEQCIPSFKGVPQRAHPECGCALMIRCMVPRKGASSVPTPNTIPNTIVCRHLFRGSQLLASYPRPGGVSGTILSSLSKRLRWRWAKMQIVVRGDHPPAAAPARHHCVAQQAAHSAAAFQCPPVPSVFPTPVACNLR